MEYYEEFLSKITKNIDYNIYDNYKDKECVILNCSNLSIMTKKYYYI